MHTVIKPSVHRRDSSIESLRLLLMFMIVVHHAVVHGLGLSGLSPMFRSVRVAIAPSDYLLYMSVNSVCICAVNCFVLISGFYGLRPTLRKFGKLMFAVLFYTLVFYVSWSIYKGGALNVLYSLMIFSHSPYWFIVDYLLLMAFAPLLNLMFERMSVRYVRMLLCVMLFVGCYLGFIWKFVSNPAGYNLFQFMTMYCIGRYVALHAYGRIQWKRAGWLVVFAAASAVTAVCMYLLATHGKPALAWRMTHYNNPLVMLAALSLFMVFKQLNFHSRAVNAVSASALAVYLFQSSPYIAEWYYSEVRCVAQWCGAAGAGLPLLGLILLMSAAMVVVSLCVDRVRLYLWRLLERRSPAVIPPLHDAGA